MADLKRFQMLKEKVDRLRRESDKAQGAYEQLLSRLKQEYGCNSLEEAKKLLAKEEKEDEALSKELDEIMDEFEDKYGEVLDGW